MSSRSRSPSPDIQSQVPSTFKFGKVHLPFPDNKYPSPLSPLSDPINVEEWKPESLGSVRTASEHPEGSFETASNPQGIHHRSNLMKRLKHATALGCIGLSNSGDQPYVDNRNKDVRTVLDHFSEELTDLEEILKGQSLYTSTGQFLGHGLHLEMYEELQQKLIQLHEDSKDKYINIKHIPPVPEWGDENHRPDSLYTRNDFEILLVNYRLKVESFLYAIGTLEVASPASTEISEDKESMSVKDIIRNALLNSPSKPRQLQRQAEMVNVEGPYISYAPSSNVQQQEDVTSPTD